jgi:hypothetical protein
MPTQGINCNTPTLTFQTFFTCFQISPLIPLSSTPTRTTHVPYLCSLLDLLGPHLGTRLNPKVYPFNWILALGIWLNPKVYPFNWILALGIRLNPKVYPFDWILPFGIGLNPKVYLFNSILPPGRGLNLEGYSLNWILPPTQLLSFELEYVFQWSGSQIQHNLW